MTPTVYDITTIDQQTFTSKFEEDGFVLVNNIFPEELLDDINSVILGCVNHEADTYHHRKHKDYGMLLCCPVYGAPFTTILDHESFFKPFNWLLGDNCIVWVYTSSCIAPKQTNFASRIHLERTIFTGDFIDGVDSLILLDDFNESNGATYLLKGSHKNLEKPEDERFYKEAIRLVAPKGTVLYFNLRLWHAGGQNHTVKWRNSLGIGVNRPYLKQRIDIPRILPQAVKDKLSDYAKNKLGFNVQVPSSFEEYYRNEKKSYTNK